MPWQSCCDRLGSMCKSSLFWNEIGLEVGGVTKTALSPLPYKSSWGRGISGGGSGTGLSVLEGQTKMQGVFGKTSGRSIFPNAPLRATSSALRRSRLDAIAKALPTHIDRTERRVGFARDRISF